MKESQLQKNVEEIKATLKQTDDEVMQMKNTNTNLIDSLADEQVQ